jgi:hypothetical protein
MKISQNRESLVQRISDWYPFRRPTAEPRAANPGLGRDMIRLNLERGPPQAPTPIPAAHWIQAGFPAAGAPHSYEKNPNTAAAAQDRDQGKIR